MLKNAFARKLMLATACLGMLSVAACTQQDEQNVLNAIKNTCVGAVTAGTMTITIVSSLAGAAPVAVISNQVGANASAICSNLYAQAQVVIDDITALGGTASVTIATNTPQSGRKSLKLRVSPGALPGTQQLFVVGPNPFAKL